MAVDRTRYCCAVKSFSTPVVEVDSELRDQLESVLNEGETVEDIVADAVRREIRRRLMEAEFLARGEASWQKYQRTGVSSSVDDVFDRLQRRINERRRELLSR